jgi:hypothetical protein
MKTLQNIGCGYSIKKDTEKLTAEIWYIFDQKSRFVGKAIGDTGRRLTLNIQRIIAKDKSIG